jgi:hypothetical protein
MDADYWRTLLDVTNAVVTKRDLGQLRAAIAPNVRRIVPHDHTNLFVIDSGDCSRLSSTQQPWRGPHIYRNRFTSRGNRISRGSHVGLTSTSTTPTRPAGKQCTRTSKRLA